MNISRENIYPTYPRIRSDVEQITRVRTGEDENEIETETEKTIEFPIVLNGTAAERNGTGLVE